MVPVYPHPTGEGVTARPWEAHWHAGGGVADDQLLDVQEQDAEDACAAKTAASAQIQSHRRVGGSPAAELSPQWNSRPRAIRSGEAGRTNVATRRPNTRRQRHGPGANATRSDEGRHSTGTVRGQLRDSRIAGLRRGLVRCSLRAPMQCPHNDRTPSSFGAGQGSGRGVRCPGGPALCVHLAVEISDARAE